MTILVIGGTGTLGRQMVKQALDEGYQVKCLIRNFRRGVFLKDWGAELVYGDLSIPSTIPTSLKGVSTIIDSATIRSTSSYTLETVDWRGKLALVEAAKLVSVKKFICFSVLSWLNELSIPLLLFKLKLEKKLEASGLNYTVFQCYGFFQGLISQYALPILEGEKIWLPGTLTSSQIWVIQSEPPLAYIDTQDAAKVVVQSLTKYDKERVALIGEEFWASGQIIDLCERLSGKRANISLLPSAGFSLLIQFFRFFEFTWNIADRLQFGEGAVNLSQPIDILSSSINRTLICSKESSLEIYLQEYFEKILKRLRETNYQQSQQSNDISFL
jgi:uncharacterized protein YbjT (DUF2867 family)